MLFIGLILAQSTPGKIHVRDTLRPAKPAHRRWPHPFVAQYGQADAPAAVVLHGGPGSGTQPSVLEWFDLARQRVVLFDQRGAGQSQPQGDILNNDSAKLVADIEMIRERLRIERWMVVGGSWGATLALLYAAQHANRIRAMVLRGSFLASQRELNWFFSRCAQWCRMHGNN